MRSSHILGGGKHPFPFAQKNLIKRAKRLTKSRVLVENQQIGKTKTEIEHSV